MRSCTSAGRWRTARSRCKAAYCAAKHGVYGFVESLRTELMHRKSRVRVSIVSLPGLNTPQFEWTQNKTGHEVQPVGPIYQPEVAAEGIVFASEHDRKEVLVGWPTVESVVGERVNSALLDRYIAKAAWDGALGAGKAGPSQQFLEAGGAGFWSPRPVRDRAKSQSVQLWLDKNRNLLLALGAGMLAVTLAASRKGD